MNDWIDGVPETLQPGMILEFKNGETFLVGDVNVNLGTCNCCDTPKSYIRRYKKPGNGYS